MTRIFRRYCRCYHSNVDSFSKRRRGMAQVYFHCTSTDGVWIDRRGAAMGDLAEAQDHATLVVRSLLSAPSTEDWRDWVLHVSDEIGEEIFCLPFAALLGKPQ
jgi:hypothetical protein